MYSYGLWWLWYTRTQLSSKLEYGQLWRITNRSKVKYWMSVCTVFAIEFMFNKHDGLVFVVWFITLPPFHVCFFFFYLKPKKSGNNKKIMKYLFIFFEHFGLGHFPLVIMDYVPSFTCKHSTMYFQRWKRVKHAVNRLMNAMQLIYHVTKPFKWAIFKQIPTI